MFGNGGRPLESRCTQWPSLQWFGRRCRRARLRCERALRSGPADIRLRFGAGVLVAAAAVGPAPSTEPPDQPRQKTLSDFGHPRRRATDVFMALNAALFALNWLTKDVLLLWGCKINSLIHMGQWWRLVTPLFLHSNIFHLAVNLHALHTLGPQVEVVSGTKRTAVIYMLSGVLSIATSFLLSPAPSVGASGAIFGLGAALAVFYMRHQQMLGPYSEAGLRSLGLTVAINAAYSLVNKKLDNWGHFGGALGGFLLAYLLGPRLVVTVGEDGARGLQDCPPVRWLAFKTPNFTGGAVPALPRRRPRRDPDGGSGPPGGGGAVGRRGAEESGGGGRPSGRAEEGDGNGDSLPTAAARAPSGGSPG